MVQKLANLDEVEIKCLDLFERLVVALERQGDAAIKLAELSAAQSEMFKEQLDKAKEELDKLV